jgi:DNA-binding PadR family transcriptional regulator
MRPASVQRILDKLRKHHLVDSAIGATDGFDNYRLTPSGVALLATWHHAGR